MWTPLNDNLYLYKPFLVNFMFVCCPARNKGIWQKHHLLSKLVTITHFTLIYIVLYCGYNDSILFYVHHSWWCKESSFLVTWTPGDPFHVCLLDIMNRPYVQYGNLNNNIHIWYNRKLMSYYCSLLKKTVSQTWLQ